MKKLILFCLFSFFSMFNASAQFFQWAQKQENSFNSAAFSNYLYNPNGNFLSSGTNFIASTGTFQQQFTISNKTLLPVDSVDAFLAVRDFSGNVLWVKQIVSKTKICPSITVDQNEDIIISGTFQDSLFIDGLVIRSTSTGNYGLFAAKFSPAGNLLWAQTSDINTNNFLGAEIGNSPSITVDDNGNIYVAREFEGTFSVNNQSLIAVGNKSDIFLLKYDSAGNFQWLRNVGRGSFSETNITIKACNNGVFLINSFNYAQTSITRIDLTGLITWRTSINSFTRKMNLTIDGQNNAYITAYYNNQIPVTIGNIVLPAGQFGYLNILLAKVDNSGNWKWAKSIVSNIWNPVNFISPEIILDAPKIDYGPKNQLVLSGVFVSPTLFMGISPTLSPNKAGTFVSKLDTAGNSVWTNVISSTLNNFNNYNHPMGLCSDNYGNYYISGKFAGPIEPGTSLIPATNGLENTFLAKIVSNPNSITGRIFIDANNNGIYDTSENPFPELILGNVQGVLNGISASDGTYKLFVPTGNTQVSIANPPRHYVITPASHTVTFSGLNQTQSGKDFALQPLPNSNDASVIITPNTFVRLGRTFNYRLTFKNHGTTVLSDTLKFNFNTTDLSYVSSSVAPLNQSTGRLTWYYQNLQPNETRNIDVTFTVPTNSVIGTPLTANATIKPLGIDLFPSDNTFTITHPITGPYDPNDKQVDKPFISPAAGVNGEFLDYTIRFQNIGTDTAFTVIVTDDISAKLELGQFEMLSASHPYKLSLNNNNQLEWRFDNILLPHSTRNELASHGFVRFRIKSKPGLVLGDSVANNAAIYFDYNAPVITNYAVTKVGSPTGIKGPKGEVRDFKLYPNPAKNYVMVAAEFKEIKTSKVRLVNMLGQVISETELPANNQIHYQMPLKDLPTGVYIIQLETKTGRQMQRLIVQ